MSCGFLECVPVALGGCGSGVFEGLLQLFVLPFAFVVLAIDKERGGAVDGGLLPALEVALDSVGEALFFDCGCDLGRIQAQLAGLGGEEFRREAGLVGEDRVVHGPVLCRVGGGCELGSFRGGLGHGVNLHQGEVAEDEAEAGAEVLLELFDDLVGDEAVGALEVAVLEERKRGLWVALDVVLVGDGTAEIGHEAPGKGRGGRNWWLDAGIGERIWFGAALFVQAAKLRQVRGRTLRLAMKTKSRKLRVGVLFGGRSGEHEVSLRSAASIMEAIDRKKYDVVPIGIGKDGRWMTGAEAQRLLEWEGPTKLPGPLEEGDVEFAAAAAVLRSGERLKIPAPPPQLPESMEIAAGAELAHPGSALAAGLDVVFPVLHGTFGEDGTIQGLFELADVAYVGSGVLGSAAGMDKDAMKRLFASAGLPQTPYVALLRSEWREDAKRCVKRIEKALEYPLFVKPANLGSSVGISKVHDRSELGPALDLAAGFDRKIVVEQGVGGPGVKPRELEVAVLGNDDAGGFGGGRDRAEQGVL